MLAPNLLKVILALWLAVLSQTPANVISDGTEQTNTVERGIAGTTITAGMPVYMDSGDNDEIKPCQATSSAAAECIGIALNGASNGQPVSYQTAGEINLGATLAVGEPYYVDDGTAGAIAVWGDLDAGDTDYVTFLGIAISTSELEMNLQASGVTKD